MKMTQFYWAIWRMWRRSSSVVRVVVEPVVEQQRFRC
jgi:hypothetical protein